MSPLDGSPTPSGATRIHCTSRAAAFDSRMELDPCVQRPCSLNIVADGHKALCSLLPRTECSDFGTILVLTAARRIGQAHLAKHNLRCQFGGNCDTFTSGRQRESGPTGGRRPERAHTAHKLLRRRAAPLDTSIPRHGVRTFE